ncbi:hypothetical protein TVAG_167000 [Trichomonas vaginalis G3]|uniref:Uncharacterized protein n=1 Tax=Trichomonas vaginalis (strain ATCC PRA-98 / G3) TaxID=412133 RepID=A2DEA7_TRIV3|nr:RelA-associated inhibitor family [Trichomonas vaginalis G3]EAY21325.1 hypothetical protein TVAG_167000 [Trichomonas vaginalis G3]KAI5548938.1 RelA-associated inhibitor family [Trichomonas vaginalis G3]|eukprot:XP_001582311.1 hypothetical protein [Trichomonas vaginalis G3]
MSNIDFQYYGKNIYTYSRDAEFMQMRTVEEMRNIMKNANLPVSQFSDVFSRIKRYFTVKEIFEMLRNTNITIGSNISDTLSLINSLSNILGLKMFSDMENSLRSYINSTERTLSEPKLISSLRKCSRINNVDNLNRIYKILTVAAEESDNETIKYAINNGYTDVKGDIYYEFIGTKWRLLQSNALIKAAYEGDLQLVKCLQKNRVNMRYRTTDAESILHAFCLSGNAEGVKYALNFFNINDVTNCNETPLFAAVWSIQLDVLKYLLDQSNVDMNITAESGSIADIACFRARQLQKLSSVFIRRELSSSSFIFFAGFLALSQ